MKRAILRLCAAAILLGAGITSSAQFNLGKVISSGTKIVSAATLTDEQMADHVRESVDWMDRNNPVLPEDDPYTVRLRNLTAGITEADGIPLNFKVYNVVDVNAFACPDGSVRVFAALMDLMSDDELLGVIGHEIGHVLRHHSKNAFRTQLLSDALKDAVAATGSRAAALTESQLGTLTQGLINARYSQKQEKEADDCGYEFLVAKGKNPWGMVMAFEKLQSLEGEQGQSTYIQKMFSSHPETQDRIERMSRRCERDHYTRPETK